MKTEPKPDATRNEEAAVSRELARQVILKFREDDFETSSQAIYKAHSKNLYEKGWSIVEYNGEKYLLMCTYTPRNLSEALFAADLPYMTSNGGRCRYVWNADNKCIYNIGVEKLINIGACKFRYYRFMKFWLVRDLEFLLSKGVELKGKDFSLICGYHYEDGNGDDTNYQSFCRYCERFLDDAKRNTCDSDGHPNCIGEGNE